MAYLEVNPDHADLLRRQGLTTPEQILRAPNVIVCGHPDRHVAQDSHSVLARLRKAQQLSADLEGLVQLRPVHVELP